VTSTVGNQPLLPYQVAATVIPVIFLALAVQFRFFESGLNDAPRWLRLIAFYGMTIVLLTILTGEVIAFQVLHTGRYSEDAWGFVRTGLVFGLTLIATLVLVQLRDNLLRGTTPWQRRLAVVLALAGIGVYVWHASGALD